MIIRLHGSAKVHRLGTIAGQRSRESALGDGAMAVIGPRPPLPPNQTRTSGLPRLVQRPSGETSDGCCVGRTRCPGAGRAHAHEGCAPFTLASTAIRTDRRCGFANEDNMLSRLAAVVYVPLSTSRAYSVCLAEQRRRRYVKRHSGVAKRAAISRSLRCQLGPGFRLRPQVPSRSGCN